MVFFAVVVDVRPSLVERSTVEGWVVRVFTCFANMFKHNNSKAAPITIAHCFFFFAHFFSLFHFLRLCILLFFFNFAEVKPFWRMNAFEDLIQAYKKSRFTFRHTFRSIVTLSLRRILVFTRIEFCTRLNWEICKDRARTRYAKTKQRRFCERNLTIIIIIIIIEFQHAKHSGIHSRWPRTKAVVHVMCALFGANMRFCRPTTASVARLTNRTNIWVR